jgi:hypothetical protein
MGPIPSLSVVRFALWALATASIGCSRPDPVAQDSSDSATSADTADELPAVEPIDSRLNIRDYGYLFWPGNHWTTWGTFENVQHVQTGFYGLALDVSSGNLDHMGLIADQIGPEEALLQDNAVITDLPTASVRYAVSQSGTEWIASSFAGSDGSTTNPSDLVDMGRFMQRVEIPAVSYTDFRDLAGSVQLAAMTRHFVLTHRATSTSGTTSLTVSIELYGELVEEYPDTEWLDGTRAVSVHDSSGEGWSFILPEQDGASSTITRSEDGTLSFEATFDSAPAGEAVALSVIAVPLQLGRG